MADSAQIQAQLVSTGAPPFATLLDSKCQLLLDQAVSGGAGTAAYMQVAQAFPALTQYLQSQGNAAYKQTVNAAGNGVTLKATDGKSTLTFDNILSTGQAPIIPNTQIVGIATFTMASPEPDQLTRIGQAGWEIFDDIHKIYSAYELWGQLIKPLGLRAQSLISNVIESWTESSSESAASVGGDIELSTMNAVAEESSEVTEVVVDGAETAEMTIAWGGAAETFGLSLLIAAIPWLLGKLSKTFVLNVQALNVSGTDFTWSIPYISEGAAQVQPQSSALPTPATITNPLTDVTSRVVQQADFSFTNTDGYEGLGFILALTPANETNPVAAVVVNVPWSGDNRIAVVDPFSEQKQPIPWPTLFQLNSVSNGAVNSMLGNNKVAVEAGIDALEGNQDTYNVVIRIRNI